jgi:hypothetical protein
VRKIFTGCLTIWLNILCLSSSQRGKGTNSARLFTTGERNALAKSKVHQWSRVRDYGSWVDLLTDLKNMAVCQERDIKHTEDIN